MLVCCSVVLFCLFFLECIGFGDLISSRYDQHHVNYNIFLFRCKIGFLVFEHFQGCLLMRVVRNLVIGTTTNETRILSGSIIDFVISVSFVGISYYFQLSKHFIHMYLIFLLQLVVWVFKVPMAMLFGMTRYFCTNHILTHSS